MIKRTPVTLGQLIDQICDLVRQKGEEALLPDYGWCVYSAAKPSLTTVCYVDDYPDINDDDEEIFPPFVVENHLKMIYRDELIQDVILNCLFQKPEVSPKEIMAALDYYDEHDCFMEL